MATRITWEVRDDCGGSDGLQEETQVLVKDAMWVTMGPDDPGRLRYGSRWVRNDPGRLRRVRQAAGSDWTMEGD